MTLFRWLMPGLVLTAGCGGFSEDSGKASVLATLEGRVENPNSAIVPQSMGVALVWHGATYRVAQELRVVPEFPVSFRLEIDQPPPASAMVTAENEPMIPTGARAAAGAVVGYEDLNQNGRLDMVEIGAERFVDRLVATNENLLVVYVEGSDAALAGFEQTMGGRPERGFGLMEIVTNVPSVFEARFFPITEHYVLPLSDDPKLNALMCTQGDATQSSGGGATRIYDERPPAYPAPGDPNVQCAPDGSSYLTNRQCTTIEHGPCRGTETFCNHDMWRRPDPVPSDWPCP